MADLPPSAALIVPSGELGQVLELCRGRKPSGRGQHLRACADAWTLLWSDLRRAGAMINARRGGVEAASPCGRPATCQRLSPGRLAGYPEGGRMDVQFG